jgi:hypothetical protein
MGKEKSKERESARKENLAAYSQAYEHAYPEFSVTALRPIKRHGGGAGNQELTALWVIDSAKATERVRAALSGRTVEKAAKELGVGLRTLRRWLATKPELKELP